MKKEKQSAAKARRKAAPGAPASSETAELRRALLAWFDRERRPLPWRLKPSAYGTVVSEFMLQQTQVATVVPYFERFLTRWPDFAALARASEQEVLSQWRGLGYYRRAGLLRAACAAIAERYGGALPANAEALSALPGFGPYTAAAVGSIALGLPMAAIDGNVRRVIARLFAIGAKDEAREIARRAQALLDPRRPGAWNEAMMELGARICAPAVPKCGECPVAEWCLARKRGITQDFPARKKAPVTRRVREVAVAVFRGGRILLLQRPAPGAFAGMWELPRMDTREVEVQELTPAAVLLRRAGRAAETFQMIGRVRSVFTHHRVEAELHAAAGRLSNRSGRSTRLARTSWVSFKEAASLPMSNPHRRMLEMAAAFAAGRPAKTRR